MSSNQQSPMVPSTINDHHLDGWGGIFKDKLGHARFAFSLARVLVHDRHEKGRIIALNGEWGSGKTGIAAMAELFITANEATSARREYLDWMAGSEIPNLHERLGQYSADDAREVANEIAKNGEHVAVIWCDAWLKGSIIDADHTLLTQITARVREKFARLLVDPKAIKIIEEELTAVDQMVGWIAGMLPDKFRKKMDEQTQKTKEKLKETGSLEMATVEQMYRELSQQYIGIDWDERKQTKTQAMRERHKSILAIVAESLNVQPKVLVFVDDVDRLLPEDMERLVSMLRRNLELPYVEFVLLYDYERVIAALAAGVPSLMNDAGDAKDAPARRYMEKIVQMSIDLPPPRKDRLNDMLNDALNEWVPTLHHPDFPNYIDSSNHGLPEYWDKLCDELIMPYLNDPRAIKRLVATTEFSYRFVGKNRIDLRDFVALQTLRLFDRPIYDFIVSHFDSRSKINFDTDHIIGALGENPDRKIGHGLKLLLESSDSDKDAQRNALCLSDSAWRYFFADTRLLLEDLFNLDDFFEPSVAEKDILLLLDAIAENGDGPAIFRKVKARLETANDEVKRSWRTVVCETPRDDASDNSRIITQSLQQMLKG